MKRKKKKRKKKKNKNKNKNKNEYERRIYSRYIVEDDNVIRLYDSGMR